MNPKKTKSGSYHVTAYIGKVNGKPKYKSITAPTKRECILKATEYINHHPADGSALSIGQCIEKYIQSKESVLSPSTVRGYYQLFNLYYKDIFDIPVKDFTEYDFQKFAGSLDLSPKSVRNICGLLSSSIKMFNHKGYDIKLPDKIEPKRTVATEDDVKRLIDAADPEMKKAIILGSCSMRRGEVAALKYDDIQKNEIYVHADIVRDKHCKFIYKDHAKTPASTRKIIVSDTIIKALGTGQGYVVKIKDPDLITKRFTRLRNKLGIDVSFHSLRRFYASLSHSLGIPNSFIMEQGGWKNENIMVRSYRHTLSDQEQKYADTLAEKLKKIIV